MDNVTDKPDRDQQPQTECCTPAEQAKCCEPEDKTPCCAPATEGCGCR